MGRDGVVSHPVSSSGYTSRLAAAEAARHVAGSSTGSDVTHRGASATVEDGALIITAERESLTSTMLLAERSYAAVAIAAGVEWTYYGPVDTADVKGGVDAGHANSRHGSGASSTGDGKVYARSYADGSS